jgi:hypothetical protein
MMYRYATKCRNGPVSRSRGRGQEGPAEESLRGGSAGCLGLLDVSTDGIRHELVARVRREIAAGVYDTPEKLEVALERMLDRLGLA